MGVLINTGRLLSWWRRASLREEVAGRCRTVGDEGEDLGKQLLLQSYILWPVLALWGGSVRADTNNLGVELGQTGLAIVVEDQHGVYHGGTGFWAAGCLQSEGVDMIPESLSHPDLIRREIRLVVISP